MNIWTNLATSQAGLLAILFALGAGPASLLRGCDAASRVALAPVLGFCLGTCVTTTLLEFFPAHDTYLVVAVLALASCALAARRTLRSPERAWLTRRDVAQMLVICVAIAVPLSAVLHERHSVGPVAYYFTDVDNYVALQQTAATTSLRDARAEFVEKTNAAQPFGDLTERVYGFISWFGSNLDATPLHANVNELLGIAAVDSFGPFLIVLLLIGGLGAFGAVRWIAGTPTWMAVLAGALFGGPLFLELWFDSYQAAIVALALLLPIIVLGADALREPRRATLGLLALVLATLVSTYPLFVPPLVALGAAAVVWQLVVRRRAGASAGVLARTLVAPALAVGALTALLNPVALVRTVGYYQRVLRDDFPLPRVAFKLPPEVLPGWLLQTREFWFLTPIGQGGFNTILVAVLIPIAFLAFAAVAVRRHRVGLALVVLAALFCVLAYGSYAGRDACTYCAQRYLLALAPIFAALLALGLWHALRAPSRVWKAVGIGGALLAVVAVGQRTRVELDRFADTSYFFDTATRSALQALPRDGRPVQVEGFFASTFAQAEQPLTYHLVNERAPGRASIRLGTDVGNAAQYLGSTMPPGPAFHADYGYVLTRLSGVATDRRLVVRRGAIALMERTAALDVTPYAGLQMPLARLDGSGVPWVLPGQTSMGFNVVGSPGRRAWARLTFRLAGPTAVPRQRGVRSRTRADVLTVCVLATGRARIREASLLLPSPGPGAVLLTGMRAVSERCRV